MEQPVSHLPSLTINNFTRTVLMSYYFCSWFASSLYSWYVPLSDINFVHVLMARLLYSYVHIIHCCSSVVPYGIIHILQYEPPHKWLLWSLIWCVFHNSCHCCTVYWNHFIQDYFCLYVPPFHQYLSCNITSACLMHVALFTILVILPCIFSGHAGSYLILLACYT